MGCAEGGCGGGGGFVGDLVVWAEEWLGGGELACMRYRLIICINYVNFLNYK